MNENENIVSVIDLTKNSKDDSKFGFMHEYILEELRRLDEMELDDSEDSSLDRDKKKNMFLQKNI